MEYEEFLDTKRKTFTESGFELNESKLNPLLKDFQKFAVKTALFKGKFALFFDCGLGKTFCQLEWAKHVKVNIDERIQKGLTKFFTNKEKAQIFANQTNSYVYDIYEDEKVEIKKGKYETRSVFAGYGVPK